MVNRIDNIKKYGQKIKTDEITAEAKKKAEIEALYSRVRGLSPRIIQLMQTAQACLDNDICIDTYGRTKSTLYNTYENGTFVANNTNNRIGFIVVRKEVLDIGIYGGLKTDGSTILTHGKLDAKVDKRDLEEFLENFDAFEAAFYSYVDKIIYESENAMKNIQSENEQKDKVPLLTFTHLMRMDYKETILSAHKKRQPDFVDQIYVHSSLNGCTCEFRIAWYRLDNDKLPVPRIEVFSEAFDFLYSDVFQKVLNCVKDNEYFTANNLADALIANGFYDASDIKRK